MNIFIAVDMEGATGVVHPDQLGPDGRGYSQGQKFLTGDVNAAIDGIRDVVPDARIVVGDGHGIMRNVLLEAVRPGVRVVTGAARSANKPLCQMEGINATFDAAFCVGYHSKAGTTPGLLAHTFVGAAVHAWYLNDRPVGEVEVNAAICASFGIPLLLVSGNSDLVPEIAEWNPMLQVVVTKDTLGPTAAICRTPDDTYREIRAAAAAALRKHIDTAIEPYTAMATCSMAVEFHRRDVAHRALAAGGVVMTNETTIRTDCLPANEAFIRCWYAVTRALEEIPTWLT
ncbi:MAG: M55 family metallopeptidase [Candidatus Kapabacteria bacterium]|jgi:D-amino peptidase|nr:M55 family metallopeptidase [Candidatus Kapabacteria bacterium]